MGKLEGKQALQDVLLNKEATEADIQAGMEAFALSIQEKHAKKFVQF